MEKYKKKKPGGGPGGSRGIQEGSGTDLERPCAPQGVSDRFFFRFLTSSGSPRGPPGEFLRKYFHVFSICLRASMRHACRDRFFIDF